MLSSRIASSVRQTELLTLSHSPLFPQMVGVRLCPGLDDLKKSKFRRENRVDNSRDPPSTRKR